MAIGPSPDMARIVGEHGCGVVSADFTPESMVRELVALDREQVQRYKEMSHRAAADLSANANRVRLQKLVREVLGR